MFNKKSGYETDKFYGNKNESKFKRNQLKENDNLYESPLTITSKQCLNSTQKFYYNNYNKEFPENCLLKDREINVLNKGFPKRKEFKIQKKSQKSMRGGNQPNRRSNHLDVFQNKNKNIKWSPSLCQDLNGVKVNMKSNYESNQKCDENDENVPKLGSQTDIRSFCKRSSDSPLHENCFETPPKKVNKNQKVFPLLSKTVNINTSQTPKTSKHLMKTLTEYRAEENNSPTYLQNNSFHSNSNELDFNNEEMPPLIETNSDYIYSPLIQILDPNTPIGLRNLGNTCYMNSIVQSIFTLKFFIEDLNNKFEDMKKICEDVSHFSMTKSLLNLYNEFNGLRNYNKDCSADGVEKYLYALKECVGRKWSPFKTKTQQDAAEFFAHIIDEIMEEFDSFKYFTQNLNPVSRNFEFETGGSLTCMKCNNKTTIENERSHALYLRLPKDNSLQTAFLDFLKDETTAHECVSTNCGEHKNVLNKYFTKLSKVLFLQLGRYTEDGIKRTEEVIIPLNIYLPLKHNNSGINVNPIAPSPLATPYRSKLQDVFNSDKVSSVVRKISFDNLDTSYEFNFSDNSIDNSNNNCIQNNIELELDSNVNQSKSSDPLTESQLQEDNITDQTNKDNTKPIIESNDSEVLDQSMTNDDEENKVIEKEINLETNMLLKDNKNNKDDNCIENYKTEKYQLVAVICHHGSSLSSGHYSSFVYNIETSQWFQCDDYEIISTDFESVQKNSKESGYCYFYVHK